MKPVADAVTIARQRRASDPRASAWVSANAGSGKTKVLVDRVLRLLLTGAKPSRILCLTFTRAAAANMAVRVFGILGLWVTMPEADLRAALTELEGEPPTARKMTIARRLFAAAVETPGGLKIETIHAFCERILHIAPFEANVPAAFSVLDETEAVTLREQALRAVLAEAASGPLAADLEAVAESASDMMLATLLGEALQARPLLRAAAGDPGVLDGAMDAAAATLGIREGETRDDVSAEVVAGSPILPRLSAFVAQLREEGGGRKTELKFADALADLASAPVTPEGYLRIFVTKKGEVAAKFGRAGLPSVDVLAAEAGRLKDCLVRLSAHDALRRTRGLLRLAAAVTERVEAVKRARRLLDFEDLLERTADLMGRPAASWVLEKLDTGIDHLLVDEAQDTNPLQWDILRAVTAEFHAGEGRRAAGAPPRTVFAVGDPKQSIFGFQGAEPRLFEETGLLLARTVVEAGAVFHRIDLTLSFRSAPAVLAAVDTVFAVPSHFEGLSFAADVDRTVHESGRPAAPGCVEVWPLSRAPDPPDAEAWQAPLDEIDEGEAPALNARRIALAVRRWMEQGIPPGEILILARKRGPAFLATIRALKQAGVPVAGADRLVLSQTIAVEDLIAAGRAALLPEDDLTLATVMKSPLLGWSEDELMALAAHRPEGLSLVAALEAAATGGDLMALEAFGTLARWRDGAARHGPFAFYAMLLGPQGGRDRLVARLGPEAADAIDTFLARAYAFERSRTPSLCAFLEEIAGSDVSVKREMEAQADEVRVMTVHGSKGLEASAVVLIDGCETARPPRQQPLYDLDVGIGVPVPVWAGSAADDPPALALARDRSLREAVREHNRLLYVAMTRAKDRLAIAPHIGRNRNEPPDLCWSEMVRGSLGAAGAEHDDPMLGGTVLVLRRGDLAAAMVAGQVAPERIALPAWFGADVARDDEPAPPLRPSAAGAADRAARQEAAVQGRFEAGARLVGTVVHALLQYLPDIEAGRRPAAARAYGAARLGRIGEDVREQVIADALGLIGHPDLAALFGEGGRAEVPLAGTIRIGHRDVPVSGQLDRLVVTEDRVLFCDFKTGARPPAHADALPESHVAQVAVYAALLERAFPGRTVEALLVYTAGARVFRVAPARLRAALESLAAA